MNRIQKQRAREAARKVLFEKGQSKAEKTKNGSALSQRIVRKPYKKGKIPISVIRKAVKAARERREDG